MEQPLYLPGACLLQIYRQADMKTRIRMAMATKLISFMGQQSRIRVPVEFSVDSNSNIRFVENNKSFVIFPTFGSFHRIKPVRVFVDYTNTGHTYVVLIENRSFVILWCDKGFIRTTNDAIVGVSKRIGQALPVSQVAISPRASGMP